MGLPQVILLFAIHIACPLLFFTNLTRNPYFTQIILLHVGIALFWILWAWKCLRIGAINFPKTALELPFLLFFGVAIVSYLASFLTHDPSFHSAFFYEGGKNFLFLILNCFAVYYCAAMVEERWRKRFIWTTFIVGTLAGIYGLLQHFGLERIWKLNINPFGTRPISTFGNPNFLSSYLLLICPLIVSELLVQKKRTLLLGFMLLVCLSAIAATFTRSTWIGVLVSFLFFFAFFPQKVILRESMRKTLLVFALFFLCVLLWPKKSLGTYQNIFQRVSEIKEVTSVGGYAPWHQRILIWSASWGMVKDHPILGKGWGLFEIFYPYYQGTNLYNVFFKNFRTHANNAHNEILEIWSQCGFLGLGVYLWMWVVILIFGYQLSRHSSKAGDENKILVWAITTAAIGIFADNFFGNVSLHFAVPAFLFWWQLGILFGLKSQSYCFELKTKGKIFLFALVFVLAGTIVYNFKREFQEIYFFKGFSIAQDMNKQIQTRDYLERARNWYSKEVNTNYELGNTYARLAQMVGSEGLNSQAEIYALKAVLAYEEALRSNPGYDEIHYNLASTLEQLKRSQEALHHYAYAFRINPYSVEAAKALERLYLNRAIPYSNK